MRRFESSPGPEGRFWEAHQQGTELVIRVGAKGTDGRERRKAYRTPDAAAAAARQAIDQMRGAGWSEVEVGAPDTQAVPEGPVQGILDDPTDPSGYLIYGDWLQSRGDPRGELVVAQATAEAETDPDRRARLEARAQELLDLWRERWLGTLVQTEEPWAVRWRCGYVAELHLKLTAFGGETSAWLDALNTSGSLAFVETLRIDGDGMYGPVLDALRRHGLRPTVRTLRLGDPRRQGGRLDTHSRTLLELFPRLEHLVLSVDELVVGAPLPPTLRTVTFAGRLARVYTAIAESELPHLVALTLDFRHMEAPQAQDRAALAEAVRRMPLRRLGLTGGVSRLLLGQILRNLPGSLTDLDLSWGPLTEDHVDLLVENADKLRGVRVHLEGIRLSATRQHRLEAELDLDLGLPDPGQRDLLVTPPRQERDRRFLLVRPSGPRFWEIRRQGATLHVRHGHDGKPGRKIRVDCGTDARAAREYRKRVIQKRAAGYVETDADAPS